MAANTTDTALMEVRDVTKLFGDTSGFIDTLLGADPQPVRAVDGVSLSIEEGEVLGIAGESGCGKTTLGKLLVKLLDPTEGEVRFDGQSLAAISGPDERAFRQRVQMIFQDPFESLNPRMTVEDAVSEPLRINDMGEDYYDRRERVIEVLEDVGLAPAEPYLRSFPHELSGGERQRVAIARALVVDPDFVVADEPVSMLDVSIRASVLNLMQDLREEYDLTYVFISHDLSLIRYMCDRTAIMYLGDIVEVGDTEDIVADPKHPYTEALFDAVPVIDPEAQRDRADVTGEVPSPRDPPPGCKFHPRCPAVIPPADWTGSQDAFRRCLQFKLRIKRETLGPEDIPEAEESAVLEEEVAALVRHGLVLDVPEAHRAHPEELAEGVDPAALEIPAPIERALREAARDVLTDEDYDAALEHLEDEVTSICVSRVPDLRSDDERVLACHLYGTDDR